MLLEASGYTVVHARDGVEAVQKASREVPDVILMDIAMPIMDGFQAAEKIRENLRTAKIPIIACTGVSRPLDLNGLFQAVIRKPFTSDVVIAKLEQLAPRSRPS
jgi:CheY-like chemotaxis protein